MQCCNMCDKSRYPKTCRSKCQLDADAVVTLESYEGKNEENKDNNHDNNHDNNMNTTGCSFLLWFFLVIVCISILICIFLRSLNKD